MDLSLGLVESCNGFAVDIGGSVIKLVYRCTSSPQLQFRSFGRDELDQAISHLLTNCLIKRDESPGKPDMFATGLGGFQFGTKFEEQLDINLKVLNEYDCFIRAVNYLLKNTDIEQHCVQITPEIDEAVKKETRTTVKFYDELREKGMMNQRRKPELERILAEKHSTTKDGVYPYILSINGSGFACIKVQENGSFDQVNMNHFGGRSFMGLGSLLTGTKSYEELIALAEKGTNLSLDLTSADMTAKPAEPANPSESSQPADSSDEDNVYAAFAKLPPRPVFLWGKALGRDLGDYSKEDLAATLLHTLCETLVTNALSAAHLTHVTHVFMAGSFVQRKSVQNMLIEMFEKQKWQDAVTYSGVDTADYHLHIIHQGSHLGALGAMLFDK